MKCVQDKQSGEIERLSDSDAEHRVKAGSHRYVPKSDYKFQRKVWAEEEARNFKD